MSIDLGEGKSIKFKWSYLVGALVWGASGFMAQPSIASGFYHILIMPLLIAGLLWVAHHERHK